MMAGRIWETAETKELIAIWAENSIQNELEGAKRNKAVFETSYQTDATMWLWLHMDSMPCENEKPSGKVSKDTGWQQANW